MFLRELTMLCLPNSLQNEIKKYNESKNRELIFQANSIEKEI